MSFRGIYPTPQPAARPRRRRLRRLVSLLGLISPITALASDSRPASTLTFFSGTVAQALSSAPTGPTDLVTTYYQFEGAWPLTTWLGVEAEVEGGQVVGNNHDASLSTSLGSVYRLNDLQEDPELFVPNLFLSGAARRGTVRWRLGKVGLEGSYDENRVARAKRTKFLSFPFTRNTSVAFPSKCLGGSLRWSPGPRTALTVGGGDANARGTKTGLTTLRGEWFTAAELTLRPLAVPSLAAVRPLLWQTRRRGVSDAGWGVSADAEVAPGVVAFARLGNGSDRFARVRGLVAGGVAWERPFGRATDFAGLAFSRATAVATRRVESVAEAVYRWQVNPWLAVSPDVQWIHHPARSRAAGAWLFGLRLAAMYKR